MICTRKHIRQIFFLKETHLHTQVHKANIFFWKELSIRKYFICITRRQSAYHPITCCTCNSNNSCFDQYAMSSQLISTWSFICVFVKDCRTVAWFTTVWDLRWCELCGFSLYYCQLWLYLSLSCEIGRVIWIFSCSTVWYVYRFLGYRSHGFDRYRCIFRLTTIVFEITRISTPY
jgi:hypothetical protein